MTTCERCRADNPPERHFCRECGWYLRWERTGAMPAGRPASAGDGTAVQPAPPSRARGSGLALLRTARPSKDTPPARSANNGPRDRAVAVTLSLPGEDGSPTDVVRASVAAGMELVLMAKVRNRGRVVERFRIGVEGLPAGWWIASPQMVHLVPFGSKGDYEQAVEIRIRPPRSSEAEARPWPIRVFAADERGVAKDSARGEIYVEPFGQLDLELRPNRRSGRLRARFTAVVQNRGNAPRPVALSASDSEELCRCTLEPAEVIVPVGGSTRARLTVRPRRQIWIGRSAERPVTLTVQADGETPTRAAAFRQRAWLPPWLLVAVAVAVVVALALWLLLPRSTPVPVVRGLPSAADAQRVVQRAGLVLDARERTVETTRQKPGTVLSQIPDPGEEVRRGSSVSIAVAVGPRDFEVPDVVGLTLPEAERALSEHFKLGTWQPADADAAARITSQWPAANEVRAAGTPINVSLRATVPAPVAVPAPGQPAAEPGDQAGSDPDQSADQTGAPEIPDAWLAYDDARNLFLARSGRRPQPLSSGGGAMQATFDPGSGRLAYMRLDGDRGRIWTLEPGRESYPGVPLSDADGDYHQPQFSPSGKAIAFVDKREGSLCLQSARPGAPTRCRRDPAWEFARVTWSPDGSALALVARSRSTPEIQGIVQYVGTSAESSRPSAWRPVSRQAGLAVPLASPQQVAWSPDGMTVAVSAGPRDAAARVMLVAVRDGMLAGAAEPLKGATGCGLAWTDTGLLTVADHPCGAARGAIYLIDPETGGRRELAVSGGDPAWAPTDDQS